MTSDESVRNAYSRRPLQGNSFNYMPEMPQTRYVLSIPGAWCLSLHIPRHYSYECKAVPQERPYVPRPSRTQQLLNPKLLPKLTSDVPQDLLKKKGVADEQLAKIEQERGRKRERSVEATEPTRKPNRSRSTSSSSSISVATISTNDSRSPRIGREAQPQPDNRFSPSKAHMETHERKRRRSLSSDGSVTSEPEPVRGGPKMAGTRSTRRKIGERSPLTRGRRRSRTDSRSRGTSYSTSSRSPERIRPGRGSEMKPRSETGAGMGSYKTGLESRPIRRDDPDPNARQQNPADGSSPPSRLSHQKRTRSPETAESQRRDMNSNSMRRPRNRSFSSDNLGRRRYSDVDERYGTSTKNNERFSGVAPRDRKPLQPPPRERSLSPFSKRLALTQAMSKGR